MLHRKQVLNLQVTQLMDVIILVCMLWLAHALRYYGTVYFDLNTIIPPFRDFFWILAVVVPFVPMLLEFQGFYSYTLDKPLWRSLVQILRVSFWMMFILGMCVLFFKLTSPSRSVLLLFAAFAMTSLLLRERIMLWRYRRRAQNEDLRESVILAGSPKDVAKLEGSLMPDQARLFQIVARIDIENEPVARLEEALHEHSAERVIFAGGHAQLSRIEEAINVCELEGVEAWLVADFIKTSIARPDFDVLGSRPMLVFRCTRDAVWELMFKDALDRIGSFAGLLVLSPLIAVTAIAIKFTSSGPVFFRQMRSGRHGKPFRMWKFRTMATDAEMRRAELEELNQMSGPVFKVDNDPRVTKLGRFLRKSSIDELPQLLNVLTGDMSLVGPRPLPVYEVEKIEHSAQRRRLSVKPGLTCLWQVSGRNDVSSFDEWVRLDLEYIDHWSLWLDVKILLRTIPVVLFGMGAK